MASIWKHPKSPNWFARYRGAGNKTVNRSTGTPKKREAEQIALGWELKAAKERDRQADGMSEGGISDALVRAERMARQGRLDAGAARDLINDLLAAAGQESVDAVTHRAWCDSWKASKAKAVKERSKWKYEQVSRDWLAYLGRKAGKPLESVTKTDAVAFRDRLANEGLSARTTNQTVKLLRGIYQEAVEQGHIGRNPFVGVDALREDDEEELRRVPFTAEEVGKLIETAEGDWKGLVILAAKTGLRLMDAARLTWRSLDLGAKRMRVKTAKTGATIDLPIPKVFEKWLKKQPRGIGEAPVFPSLADKSGAGKSGLSMAFKRLMERAEIAAGLARERDGRGRSTSQKSFHSLRHFAESQLAAAGVRAEVARAIRTRTSSGSTPTCATFRRSCRSGAAGRATSSMTTCGSRITGCKKSAKARSNCAAGKGSRSTGRQKSALPSHARKPSLSRG